MRQIARARYAFAFSLFAYAAFAFSLIYLFGFLTGFAGLPVTVDRGPEYAPWLAALVDLLLIVLFGIQHSVMARRRFKAWWTRHVPPAIERSTYVLISSVTTLALCLAWLPVPGVVWQARSAFWLVSWWSAFAAGFGLLLVASFQIDHWELLGLRQTWMKFRGGQSNAGDLSERGLYGLVRHPIYVGWLLLFWVTPRMSIGHLLLAAGMTVYVCVAIRFEERDLIREHGAPYVDYRRRVPALLPLRVANRRGNSRDGIANRLLALTLASLCAGLSMAPSDVDAGSAVERLTLDTSPDRSALLVVPDAETSPRRLVVMLHGAGGNAERIRRFTAHGLERLAAKAHWIVVYPEGVGGTWNDCRRTPSYAAKQLAVDDVAFLAALIEQLRISHDIAAEDVLVAGFSNGGQMAIRVALERPDVLGAIAVVAAQLPAVGESVCTADIPAVRSLWINGTEDPFVPARGGPSVGPDGGSLGRVQSLAGTIESFSDVFPGSVPSRTERLPESDGRESTFVSRTDWISNGEIVLRQLMLHGSGHVVPQDEADFPAIAGPSAGDVDFAEIVADFFAAFETDAARPREATDLHRSRR
jgi:poly(3-hydroxybutyrate) depolymerase/protein-S-isoprenylcysteine O-methyltransferase Ste14